MPNSSADLQSCSIDPILPPAIALIQANNRDLESAHYLLYPRL
jgi:hypothetical protein